MGKQMTKIGARVLSNSEMNMILPNAESVFEQIEVFRGNISDTAEGQEFEQKTNNIGIIGRRGAGKTSILKTFRHMLQEKNEKREKNKDIILTPIVPENMSSGTTLMDVILGMLKAEVEKERTDGKSYEDCIYSGRSPLEKAYNELVKQYCYIKKDYRDILIQQFTTEQNYVDKTKEVFNSDTEFINLFRKFIDCLLKGNTDSGEKNDALLFLFIDDIDLSTTRCTDVVRTLLSYLSLPRIVTFISGDMETFEEALTLDFLRQENALHNEIFKETYFSAEDAQGSRLLDRKKEMAYEYLKKIIPPAYRKRIKYWPLEERGRYQVAGNDGSNQSSLMELLIRMTDGQIERGYFAYEEDKNICPLGPVYHMFDSTSRSLNNVYNVLQELCGQKEEEGTSNKVCIEERGRAERTAGGWRLLETIVDSKLLYSRHKEDLLQKILILGREQVRVDFENAGHLLEFQPDQTEDAGENAFALFIFIDFASRLFDSDQRRTEVYLELKNRMIGEYLRNDAIDGRISGSRKPIDLLKEIPLSAEKNDNMSTAGIILYRLLQQGDFILGLYLIKYLGKDEAYRMIDRSVRKTKYGQADLYKLAYALAKALTAMCQSTGRQAYLAELYDLMPHDLAALLDGISLDTKVIYGERLVPEEYLPNKRFSYNSEQTVNLYPEMADRSFNNIENFMTDAKALKSGRMLLWAQYENNALPYWIYYDKYMRETDYMIADENERIRKLLHAGIKHTLMVQLEPVMQQYEVKPLQETDYSMLVSGNTKSVNSRQCKAIILIDKHKLWTDSYVKETAGKYLEATVVNYIDKIISIRPLFHAGGLLKNSYRQLKDCYKGSSNKALIVTLEHKITNFLKLIPSYSETADGAQNCYMTIDQVLILQCLLEEFLTYHYRIQYGKKEARQFLAELKEMPLVFPDENWAKIIRKTQDPYNGLLNEEEFIKKIGIPNMLRDKKETIVENCYRSYYIDNHSQAYAGGKPLRNIVKDNLKESIQDPNSAIICYIMYLVQKKRIEDMIKELGIDSEATVSQQECNFYLHSYLRYHQANESDAAKAGAEAETVASLARDLLDSEALADARHMGNIYEQIGQELELTEEEFGELFYRKAGNTVYE